MLESKMMGIGLDFLSKKNDYQLVSYEVPFLSRCIDVVLLDNNENLITIEFKIKNWRQAIEQAKNHMLGADKAYICLPERKLTDSLISALNESQIGLLFFNPEIENILYEVIPSTKKVSTVKAFRDILLNNVSKINQ